MDNLIEGKAIKEPTYFLSVLFFIIYALTIILTIILSDINKEDYNAMYSTKGNLHELFQALLLHCFIFAIVFCGEFRNLIIRLLIITILVSMSVGITTAKMFIIDGFKGFLIGVISFLPHYLPLFVLYRHTLNKIFNNMILTKTDYLKCGIILIIISVIHVFVSGRLIMLLI